MGLCRWGLRRAAAGEWQAVTDTVHHSLAGRSFLEGAAGSWLSQEGGEKVGRRKEGPLSGGGGERDPDAYGEEVLVSPGGTLLQVLKRPLNRRRGGARKLGAKTTSRRRGIEGASVVLECSTKAGVKGDC